MRKSESFRSNQGLTLIEVLVSLVILSIIVVSISTMFIQTERFNQFSENITDATYAAQTVMEEVYGLSTEYQLNEAINQLQENGFISQYNHDHKYILEKNTNKHYTQITINEGQLTEVIVKVYQDAQHNKLEAQMETLIAWKV